MDANALPPLSPTVEFKAFLSIDLRVAEVIETELATGTRKPCRILRLNMGSLGPKESVGQFALIPEEALIGKLVIVCSNFQPRMMGPHRSEVLVLGTPHPDSPQDQSQAIPIFAATGALPGQRVF